MYLYDIIVCSTHQSKVKLIPTGTCNHDFAFNGTGKLYVAIVGLHVYKGQKQRVNLFNISRNVLKGCNNNLHLP